MLEDKKGFTLVELLAVIVVLGLLAAIAIPNVLVPIKNHKQKIYEVQINNIKKAAKSWSAENVFSLPTDGQEKTIYLKDIKTFLDNDIINPLTDEKFGQCLEIYIKKVSGQDRYTYEVNEETVDKETGC